MIFIAIILFAGFSASGHSETMDDFLLCSSTGETINNITFNNTNENDDNFFFTNVEGQKTVIYRFEGNFFTTKCRAIYKIKVPKKVETCTRDLYIYYEYGSFLFKNNHSS